VKTLKQITVDMLRDQRTWPCVTHLCVKQGEPLGRGGKCGIIVGATYRDDKVVVRNHPGAGEMYGGPFIEEYGSVTELINAGWVVD